MAKVTVTIPRVVFFKEGDGPELAYGPGKVEVPEALAQSLKEWGFVDAKGNSATGLDQSDKLLPSQELAPNFPGREFLFLAGHTTYSNVVELTPEQIRGLRGIGEAKATQIEQAIKEAQAKLPQRVVVAPLPTTTTTTPPPPSTPIVPSEEAP